MTPFDEPFTAIVPRVAFPTSKPPKRGLDDGLAQFDCTIYREVEADHIVALLELHAVAHVDASLASSPLVFHRRGFGTVHLTG